MNLSTATLSILSFASVSIMSVRGDDVCAEVIRPNGGGGGGGQDKRQLDTCYDQRPYFQYNTNEWWNAWGDKCSDFEQNPNWCSGEYGTTPSMEMTAQEACCVCGGGTDNFVPLSHMDNCVDVANFRDAAGDSCEFYGEPGSDTCVVYGEWGDDESMWPSRGCCSCGGGVSEGENLAPTPSPTASAPIPTPSPTPFPTPSSTVRTQKDAIEVPAELVPNGADPNDKSTRYCFSLDLSSIVPPPNPGYRDETLDDEVLTGEEKWKISFYAMLYANCERQARGLDPLHMWDGESMREWSITYEFREGHDDFDFRANTSPAGTHVAAEAAGGGPFPGIEMYDEDLERGEDDNNNGSFDLPEIGRRVALGLLDHGDSMIDPEMTYIYAAVTIGPTADKYLNAILMYGFDYE